jgi:hypothetical protein
MWMVIIGVVLATLGPLFGFLVGSMMGSTTDTGDLDPIWFSLFLGMVVGGLGIGLALLGARRLMMGRRGRETTRVSA